MGITAMFTNAIILAIMVKFRNKFSDRLFILSVAKRNGYQALCTYKRLGSRLATCASVEAVGI